jgi:N-acetylmuramoyl-L-alanine amidase
MKKSIGKLGSLKLLLLSLSLFQLGWGCDVTSRESAYQSLVQDQKLLLEYREKGDIQKQIGVLKDILLCGDFLKIDVSFYRKELAKLEKGGEIGGKTKSAPILRPEEKLKTSRVNSKIVEETRYPVDKVVKFKNGKKIVLPGLMGGEVTATPPSQPKGEKKVSFSPSTGGKFTKVKANAPVIRLAFPHPVKVKHFTIKGKKYKEVFDLKGAFISRPYFKTLPNGKKLKVAQFKKDTLRVVIEGDSPFQILYSLENGGKRFVVRFKPEVQKKNSTGTPPRGRKITKKGKKEKTKRQKKGKEGHLSPAELAFSDTPPNPQLVGGVPKIYKKVIVIDPGHGGKDPGGVGYHHLKEKQVVLGIARQLAQILKGRGYKVYLTRSGDKFIPLKERTRFANEKHANLFISIHGNIAYHHDRRLRGIEIYYLSPTQNKRALDVAMEENKGVQGLNTSDQKVILNFLNKERMVESHKLGIDVMNHLYARLKKRFPVRKNRVRGGPFWVLVGTQMPSILIEAGYLTNPTDAKLLKSSKFQREFAIGIANGIDAYFRKNR